ncbi:MarR family transcriptional regulator [Peribacillus sp. SI8-4]|uniref:MarR family winged helix-turn-helix transcriptional regulator n=1 Tax=Peribacillus sp. SI8-4 TaxID=3048009 RepID=UPI0025533AFF|nr:MarR family transcriptional regulator [Peribacillus sp. SI8-4]
MRGLGTRTILYQQKVATSLGLYNHDFIAVDILRETGPITAGELAKKTGLTTGSITALVDRLEKFGYVRRQNDPNDRRRVIIVPDYEDKEEVYNTYLPLQNEMITLVSTYTPEELELITRFMEKASSVLDGQIRELTSNKQGTK